MMRGLSMCASLASAASDEIRARPAGQPTMIGPVSADLTWLRHYVIFNPIRAVAG